LHNNICSIGKEKHKKWPPWKRWPKDVGVGYRNQESI